MKFMLVTALIFALNSPSYALEDGVVCDTVDTSAHGTLLAKRVTDGRSEILKMCIGQLRLLDPRNNITYCLAKNVDGKEEEVLECGKKTGQDKGNKTTGTGKCPLKTQMPDKVVISSTGEAADAWSGTAGWLGQYEIVRDKDTIPSAEVYYIQSNSQIGKEDPKAEPSYLFPDEYCRWSVSMLPNTSNSDQYRNRNPSRTVPTGTGGWKINHFKKNMFVDDPTLTVTPGPYPPLATYGFIVKVSGEAARMYNVSSGYFAKTNEWWMGRPVYKNNQGRGLMHGNLGWMIGPKSGSWEIRGLGSHQSPVDQGNWEYLFDSKPDVWERADVEVLKN